jgi:dTMP kinase
MTRGKLITFEGPEAGGKSTQIKYLKSQLETIGYEILQTREPGGTRVGEAIRGILQHDAAGEAPAPACETLLYEAARAQIMKKIVNPALSKGVYVLLDRFYDSTTAYQGYGRGFDIDKIKALNMFATGGIKPDLTLLLDLPVEEGFARLTKRNLETGAKADRIELEEREFHERLRKGYLEIAASEPERVKIIDAMQTPEKVAEDIWNTYLTKFHPK